MKNKPTGMEGIKQGDRLAVTINVKGRFDSGHSFSCHANFEVQKKKKKKERKKKEKKAQNNYRGTKSAWGVLMVALPGVCVQQARFPSVAMETLANPVTDRAGKRSIVHNCYGRASLACLCFLQEFFLRSGCHG